MQTPIIKYYKVLTRQNSRWYKIILLIQQGKTSAMYIIKTQDREVRDKIQFVGNLILGKHQSSPIYLAFYCRFIHLEHQHYSCTMKNYHINYIL